MTKIYEITDSTSDETFFCLGIFSTQQKALDSIDEVIKAQGVSRLFENDHEEYCEITIKERELDTWCDGGKEVVKLKWTEEYDKDDELYWKPLIDQDN